MNIIRAVLNRLEAKDFELNCENGEYRLVNYDEGTIIKVRSDEYVSPDTIEIYFSEPFSFKPYLRVIVGWAKSLYGNIKAPVNVEKADADLLINLIVRSQELANRYNNKMK